MPRAVVTTLLVLAALAILISFATVRLADFREAQIEATYPASGQFVEVNGAKIHVVVKGSGTDLVLIHGAGGNARELDVALADWLSDRYRLFIVDRPGHGWSERQGADFEGAFNTRAESPMEQARALSAAVQQLGAENPVVLGHSYGGAVAMAWALEEPARAIIIVSGVTLPWPGDIDLAYRVMGSSLGGAILTPLAAAFVPDGYVKYILGTAFAPQAAPPGYFSRGGIPLATRTETLRANNRQVRALRPFIVEQSERYREIQLPIEILHGTEDTTVYREVHAEPLADMLPNARLTILDGIGHMPHHVVPGDIEAAIDRAKERARLR